MIHSCKGGLFMHVRAVHLCCALLVLSGCMTERVQPAVEYPSVPKQSTFLVKKVEFDEHGRPLFPATLRDRPGKTGEAFTLVHAVNNRPVRSYDIAIIEQRQADMGKPFAIVYEWTGRGFQVGLDFSGRFTGSFYGSGREAVAYLAIMTAPIVIGGVTGFVVGIVSSIPETAIELRRVIVNARETVIGYTLYEYDEKGRIRFMKMYPPEEYAEELVKTEYHYTGDSDVPCKTEVTSPVEKKTRMIRLRPHACGAIRDDLLVLRDLGKAVENLFIRHKLRSLEHPGIRLVLVPHIEDQDLSRGHGR